MPGPFEPGTPARREHGQLGPRPVADQPRGRVSRGCVPSARSAQLDRRAVAAEPPVDLGAEDEPWGPADVRRQRLQDAGRRGRRRRSRGRRGRAGRHPAGSAGASRPTRSAYSTAPADELAQRRPRVRSGAPSALADEPARNGRESARSVRPTARRRPAGWLSVSRTRSRVLWERRTSTADRGSASACRSAAAGPVGRLNGRRRARPDSGILRRIPRGRRRPRGHTGKGIMAETVAHVVGARPNFMKAAPVIRALAARGQSARSSSTPASTTTRRCRMSSSASSACPSRTSTSASDRAATRSRPRRSWSSSRGRSSTLDPALIVVYGDVNSTLAAAVVASKLGRPLAHVEAGLRSFDRTMPEEINRVVTDVLADLLFTTSPEAEVNLVREGVDPSRIHFVGNPMIDTLLANLDRFDVAAARARHDLGRAVRRRHAPPARQRRRPGDRAADRRGGARCGRARPARDPAPSARPGDARGGRSRRRPAGPGRRPARLRRLPVARPWRRTGRHRLGRDPGGDDGPRRPLPDAPPEHRAADHDQPRDEPTGRAGGRRGRRSSGPRRLGRRRRTRPRRCGTAPPASGSPRSSSAGWLRRRRSAERASGGRLGRDRVSSRGALRPACLVRGAGRATPAMPVTGLEDP